uniref:PA14 domain-containing protein n=1 Tax=Alexandrium catenella TaxID=2925 RepID=A0A7S1LY94_ALECA
MTAALQLVVLIFAPGALADGNIERKPLSATGCRAGTAACPVTQDHLLLQRGQAAVKHGALNPEMLDQIFFEAIVRDFKADHPDFQSFDGHVTGLVEPRLGADGRPVFRGGPVLSTKENFDQWYRDVPGVNIRLPMKLALTRSAEGTYVYENPSFFPIDGKGWKDSAIALDGNPHNFYFTLELASAFIYQGGEQFTFRGDDDVWVFINGEKVIDLGGVHNPIEGSVDLDTLDLTPGSDVELHFFFAERRCCGSNFRLETTIQFPVPAKGTCVLWGDPHVSTFDRGLAEEKESVPLLGMYASGDYWLVKSEWVGIQGRYGPTRWSAGQAALLALGVGGPFLGGHTLIIEPMEGKVTWDGKEILQEMPSEFFIKGFVNVSFHGPAKEQLIDPGQGALPLRTVTARLPKIVDLTVNRWSKHIDAIIRMRQLPEGQDGHCGNFNLDASDDTKALILERAGAEVGTEDSFFGPWPENLGEHGGQVTVEQEMHVEDCQPRLREEAERLCVAARVGASKALLEACIYDVCFGGKEFAAEDAAVERQVQSG